jgi:hypothetical protein
MGEVNKNNVAAFVQAACMRLEENGDNLRPEFMYDMVLAAFDSAGEGGYDVEGMTQMAEDWVDGSGYVERA